MPVNALAPRSRNELQNLLTQAAASPQYGALVDYLTSRRMMPPIQQKPLGSVAEFETSGALGGDLPKTGIVNLSYSADPKSVVHELTHAAQRQMEAQYFELRQKQRDGTITPQEQQFMRGYEKLIYDRGEMFGNRPQSTQSVTAQRIAPLWREAKKDYRATGSELAAFGMGSTVAPNTGYPAPAHVDPSYATEFSVLMDLARRVQPVIPGR